MTSDAGICFGPAPSAKAEQKRCCRQGRAWGWGRRKPALVLGRSSCVVRVSTSLGRQGRSNVCDHLLRHSARQHSVKPVIVHAQPAEAAFDVDTNTDSITEEDDPSAEPSSIPDLESDPDFQKFRELSEEGNLIPLYQRVMSDQLTPVMAFRCLVSGDDRESPSFLLESVENGNRQGRYSFVGAQPALEVVVHRHRVVVLDHNKRTRTVTEEEDPMTVPVRLSSNWRPARVNALPDAFTGGWVGYAGYDTVRYVYKQKLAFSSAPEDDRGLADIHLALYDRVVVFDNASKLAYIVVWVNTDAFPALEDAYSHGTGQLQKLCEKISKKNAPQLLEGNVGLSLSTQPAPPSISDMTKEEYCACVEDTKEYIQGGDIFQLVLSQRFERRTFADPFEIYRSLRVVNPSPYMVYLQARGCIIVASSPEILCKVDGDREITNRPLAGTRRRGLTPEEDRQLEDDLLADEKECAEHVMLVDLGRNDVGKVAEYSSLKVENFMQVERYSHVMHISSTVTGKLLSHLNCWDALRAALPVGTISGAPKVRAMQIIDELEVHQRGPYGGGIGHVSFTGELDMCLALRTMVIPSSGVDTLYKYDGPKSRREWVVHIQAGAGLVADSVPETEYEECLNKAAALGRSIDLAEQAFLGQEISS